MQDRFYFRGKALCDGEWYTGCLMELMNGECSIGYTEVAQETIGQCTGLKDKNGTLIFEGDILDCEVRLVIVKWHDKCGAWDSILLKILSEADFRGITPNEWGYRTTIIGNIHDNPELLE